MDRFEKKAMEVWERLMSDWPHERFGQFDIAFDIRNKITKALREERKETIREAITAIRANGCDPVDHGCRTCDAIDAIFVLLPNEGETIEKVPNKS